MHDLDIAKLKAVCIDHLEDLGFDLGQSWDFSTIETETVDLGKSFVTPNLSSHFHDLTEGDSFWLTMHRNGELKAVMGMHLQNLGGQTFSRFLKSSYKRLYPSQEDDVVTGHAEQVDRLIRGQICYMGDLFFEASIRGSRSQLMCFVHLAHALCFDKWHHDWTYAFHRREDVLSGYADRYGFANRWPGFQKWTAPPPYRSSSEYLSTISREEFEQRAVYYAQNPWELLEEDPKTARKLGQSGSRSRPDR